MFENLFVLVCALALVVQGATLATKYSAKLAGSFHLSKYVVGFMIVAFISILPETLISINAAIEGIPEFGLATLLGSNVADLTLIFAIIILYSGRGIKIESKILKDVRLYPFFLLLPLIFGLNGHYSRIEGTALIIAGGLFYYMVFANESNTSATHNTSTGKIKNSLFLILSMAFLLIGSHFSVTAAHSLADSLEVTPILIGLLVVSLGTTLPELLYAIKSAEKKDDGLAVGDILGTVLADATIVVGILAAIQPFFFPVKIVYITGGFMMVASLILLHFMQTGRIISKKEGYILLVFWGAYALTEFVASEL